MHGDQAQQRVCAVDLIVKQGSVSLGGNLVEPFSSKMSGFDGAGASGVVSVLFPGDSIYATAHRSSVAIQKQAPSALFDVA